MTTWCFQNWNVKQSLKLLNIFTSLTTKQEAMANILKLVKKSKSNQKVQMTRSEKYHCKKNIAVTKLTTLRKK